MEGKIKLPFRIKETMLFHQVFKTVEVFSMTSNNWEVVQDLNTPRDGAGVCTYDGKVFAAGGTD